MFAVFHFINKYLPFLWVDTFAPLAYLSSPLTDYKNTLTSWISFG